MTAQRSDEETPLLPEAEAQKPKKTPLPYGQLSILLVLQLAEPLTSQVISPFAPDLIRNIGITHGDEAKVGHYVGMMHSIFFATQALTVLQWSRLSDILGRKPIIMTGLTGLSLSMYFFGLSRTFWGLVLSRCLNGALNGNIGVLKSMIGEITDSTNLADAYSFLPISWLTGATVGPMIGGSLSRPAEQFPRIFGHNQFLIKYPYFLACAVPATFSALAVVVSFFFLKETVKNPVSFRQYLTRTFKGDDADAKPTADTPLLPGNAQAKPLPLRRLLISRVIISAGNYGLLALVDICYRSLQPVYLSTPVALGGLGLSPAAIGAILSTFGICNGGLQILFFSRTIDWFGAKRVYMVGMLAALPTFALYPVINLLARLYGYHPIVWATLIVQCALSIAINFCYGSVFIYITASAPNRASLGGVNGLAQMLVSIMRALGPALANSLFSISIDAEHHWLGGMFVYVFLAVLTCFALWGGCLLPAQVWQGELEAETPSERSETASAVTAVEAEAEASDA